MIDVVITTRLSVSVEAAWTWLADLDRLMAANLFHREAHFLGTRQRGVGVRANVPHGLAIGPAVPRILSVTHWDEGQRIRWTDTDPRFRRYAFPHSEQFRLEPLGDAATLLIDEVHGTLNLPIARDVTDKIAEKLLMQPVVRRQLAFLKNQIERSVAASERSPQQKQ